MMFKRIKEECELEVVYGKQKARVNGLVTGMLLSLSLSLLSFRIQFDSNQTDFFSALLPKSIHYGFMPLHVIVRVVQTSCPNR